MKNNAIALQKNILIMVVSIIITFLPILASAHLIAITATKPFPATVAANTSTNAIFTITNITTKANITVIDQSKFPSDSGLTITSSTCGNVLAPAQSCTIQVTLKAQYSGQSISAQLKEWAKPTVDGVQFPINVKVVSQLPTITLVPIDSSKLPALRDPVIGTYGGKWLIVSGSFGNFHDFNNTFNTSIYVYNPATAQIYSVDISSSNLPVAVKNQLASTSPNTLQDGDTLYLIGGFYTPDNTNFTTLNTITSINVPGMMAAVMRGDTNLAPFVTFNTSVPQFLVTGGQLGKIGNYFYLAFGQRCEGAYCANLQVYTNSIYKFSTDPTLSAISIVNTVTHPDLDGSGWRRRDYTLTPVILNSAENLFALGGPFTPGSDAFVWTNGITFDGNLQSNDHFINQQGNQYLSPHVSMYSAAKKMTYVATFSGLSNLYWSTNGLVYDNSTPYGNIMDLITTDDAGRVNEYANLQPLCSGRPLSSCLYMGLMAKFIPEQNHFDSRRVLLLDELSQTTPTLIGYVYAGLLSPVQDIFGTNSDYPTNQVYAVYVVPAAFGTIHWQNVSNFSS